MPISCDPNDLATAATCFSKLSWRQRQEIRVYLLCTLVNGDTPVECTPDALAAAAACYAKLSSGQLDQIETYLFCQLASGGPPPAVTTLYSGNGTLAGDRTVDAAGHVLAINSPSEFTISTDPLFASDNSFFRIRTTDGAWYVNNPAFTVFGTVDMAQGQVQIKAATLSGRATLLLDGTTGMTAGSTGEKIGFLGATPTIRTANANQAVATDPASTQTLANAARQELIDRGFWKGSA